MNAQMFHPAALPCKMKCFSFGDDTCQFKEMCQYRWAILASLARKIKVARKRWREQYGSLPCPEVNHVTYSDMVDLFKVYLKAGFICWYCLEPMVVSHGFGDFNQPHVHHVNDFSLEHKIPLSEGGTNEFSNLAFCCIDCNNRMNNEIMPVSARQEYARQHPWKANPVTIGDIYAIQKRS